MFMNALKDEGSFIQDAACWCICSRPAFLQRKNILQKDNWRQHAAASSEASGNEP